jgi:hypothetical protein
MRRRIISIIAPPPRISNPIVPRTLSQQQTSFPDVDDIICIILLDFFSNSNYSFINLKSVIAFRLISKKIAEAIDRRLEEIHPNYPQIIQMGADVFNLLKTPVNSSVIVIAGFSPYKIKIPRLQVTDQDNDKNTLALLTGPGSRNYTVLKERFDDAFQNNELILSCLFRNLKSPFIAFIVLILFVSSHLFLIRGCYYDLHFKAMIGIAPEYKIIYNIVTNELFSCDTLHSFHKTKTMLWDMSVQTLIDFCVQQESLCHPFTSNENFYLGNRTLTRECRNNNDYLIPNVLIIVNGVLSALNLLLAIPVLVALIINNLYDWLKELLSEKLPLVWSEKTARNINNFFNPSLRTSNTVLDELPAQKNHNL